MHDLYIERLEEANAWLADQVTDLKAELRLVNAHMEQRGADAAKADAEVAAMRVQLSEARALATHNYEACERLARLTMHYLLLVDTHIEDRLPEVRERLNTILRNYI